MQLIAGEDRFGHFTVLPPPTERLAEADIQASIADMARRNTILYEGAEGASHRKA